MPITACARIRVRTAVRAATWMATVSIAFVLSAEPARAADAQGAFAVKGVGLITGSEFTKLVVEKNTPSLTLYVGWLAGYLSASNQYLPETFDLVPWQSVGTLTSAAAKFCESNPDVRFGNVAVRLAMALKPTRLTTRSDLVSVEHGAGKAYLYKETIRRIQAALSDQGMFTGDVNGEFGEGTREALKRFQSEKQIESTGLPNQRTLYELLKTSQP